MASVVISGDSSGAITLTAPAVAGTRTITLPAVTGTVSLGFVLLGTIATTSGTSATLSSLTLTSYKQIYLVFNSVGMSAASGSGHQLQIGTVFGSTFASGVQQTFNGAITIDLFSGYGTTITTNPNTSSTLTNTTIKSGITTASTSITITTNNVVATFNANSISVYGLT
jgi:hypothetical protein